MSLKEESPAVHDHTEHVSEGLDDAIHHPQGWVCWRVIVYSESLQISTPPRCLKRMLIYLSK